MLKEVNGVKRGLCVTFNNKDLKEYKGEKIKKRIIINKFHIPSNCRYLHPYKRLERCIFLNLHICLAQKSNKFWQMTMDYHKHNH